MTATTQGMTVYRIKMNENHDAVLEQIKKINAWIRKCDRQRAELPHINFPALPYYCDFTERFDLVSCIAIYINDDVDGFLAEPDICEESGSYGVRITRQETATRKTIPAPLVWEN